MKFLSRLNPLKTVAAALFLVVFSCQVAAQSSSGPASREPVAQIGKRLMVGDVVFTHVRPIPFKKVSEATQSWANHVGIVVEVSGDEPVIAESTFPFSRVTGLSRFIARSEDGRVAVSRLDVPLTEEQKGKVRHASAKRLGIFYDTGFDLYSKRQFCSRFVREVLSEAIGAEFGDVETFRALLTKNPSTDLGFWRFWYLGNIPWQRQTVTPASLLQSARLHKVFDGFAD